MRRLFTLLVLLFIFFIGCESGLLYDSQTDLPDDQINDILRGGEFTYAVLAPVQFTITVNSFDTSPGGSRAMANQAPFVVQLTDAGGDSLYIGSVAEGSALSGEVLIPVTAESLTLTVDSPEHELRQVVIPTPAQYAEIDRVMSATVVEKTASDRDADGIDDCYDAFPDDPTLAFTRTIPTSDNLRIAFEDNFPGLGDGDYNDFVADYRIVEYRSPKNSLVHIDGVARAVARGAGYDHEFGIVVDFEGHEGSVEVQHFDGNGVRTFSSLSSVVDSARIVLFPSTRNAFTRESEEVSMDNVDSDTPASFGHTAMFSITYTVAKTSSTTDVWAPYNPYLVIENPNLSYAPDVHLIGKAPLADSENPPEFTEFRDDDGFPRALLVPDNWMPPTERTHIETAYSEFALWRESLGATNSDWYLYSDAEHVVDGTL